MSRFEFNIVLVSILLAFAATELATVWGRALKSPGTRIPLPFALLMVWLFLSLVLHWFGLWSYREVPFDQPVQSLTMLLPSLTLAVLTHMLSPPSDARGPSALADHYASMQGRAFPIAGVFMAISALPDHTLPGVIDPPPFAFFGISGASLAALALTRNGTLHSIVLGLNTAVAVAILVLSRT